MATPNQYSLKLDISLLEDMAQVAVPGTSVSTMGALTESFYGVVSLAGSASDVNVKLGTLTDPKFLSVYSSGDNVSLKIASAGTSIAAYPFACMGDVTNGLGISEIWLSNGDSSARTVEVLAGE